MDMGCRSERFVLNVVNSAIGFGKSNCNSLPVLVSRYFLHTLNDSCLEMLCTVSRGRNDSFSDRLARMPLHASI